MISDRFFRHILRIVIIAQSQSQWYVDLLFLLVFLRFNLDFVDFRVELVPACFFCYTDVMLSGLAMERNVCADA